MNNKSIPKWEGLRGRRFKYARYYEQETPFEFLHDLQADPMELKNLAADPEYQSDLMRMRERCGKLSKEYDNQAKRDARRALEKAKFGMLDADHGHTDSAVDEALALDPESAEARMARADANEKAGKCGKALVDLDVLVTMHPEATRLLERRGNTRFFNGDMEGAIADYDRYLELHPAAEPHHWQRGIAYYYAGQFEKGVKQFEIHQGVNSSDVENAFWHFLCVNKIEGFETARKKLIPIKGDTRVPMAEVHQLLAGKAKPEDVIAATAVGDPDADGLKNRLCYAHLYLGLYFEAKGDAAKSLHHIRLAAKDHAMPHYMGEVARVHLRARTKKAK